MGQQWLRALNKICTSSFIIIQSFFGCISSINKFDLCLWTILKSTQAYTTEYVSYDL